jgi:microcompartment protein CcmL/EutN
MSQKALGMIETIGILAAYEAADVALKSANVKLVGYEISRGGLIVIKFTGDVSAVRSAVDAGKAAASRLSKVWASHVIARPAEQIEKMINSEDTINNKSNEVEETEEAEETEDLTEAEAEVDEVDELTEESDDLNSKTEEAEEAEEAEDLTEAEADEDNELTEESDDLNSESKAVEEIESEEKKEEDICNLCGDPACPRVKGDLHTDCIHYDDINS